MKHLIGLCIAMCLAITSSLRASAADQLLETMNRQLSAATSAHDSIVVLTDIFDYTQPDNRSYSDSIAEVIYQIAARTGNTPKMVETLILRANANTSKRDELEKLLNRTYSIADSAAAKEAQAFIRMNLNSWFARQSSDPDRRARFRSELRKWTLNPPRDLYDRIILLHSVCLGLSNESGGELLSQYVERLTALGDQLPPDKYSVRNQLYVQAAIVFYDADQPELGMKADHKLLNIIDSLEIKYAAEGRTHRKYDTSRYIIYSRLLSNYEHLTPAQVQEYYDAAMEAVNRSDRARQTNSALPMPQIYYAMFNSDYAEALALLKKVINRPDMKPRRRQLLRMMIQSAQATGDQAALQEALLDYYELNEAWLKEKTRADYRELQILYDVSNMKREMSDMSIERQRLENEQQHRIIVLGIIIIALLVALGLSVWIMYRRKKRAAAELEDLNDRLQTERDSLRRSQEKLTAARDAARSANEFKTDFIRNLSHEMSIPLNTIIEYSHLLVDCSDATNKEYLSRYSDLIDINSELLRTVVNDVFNTTEVDSDSISVVRRLTDLENAMDLAIQTVKPSCKSGVEMTLDPKSPHLDIMIDPRRLQQIMVNMLENAAKFTKEGRIVVSYGLASGGEQVVISVTDTGIGIPAEYGERIFERSVVLDDTSDAKGLGLPMARMMARVLGGNLTLDTTYTRGARFVLTLPYITK